VEIGVEIGKLLSGGLSVEKYSETIKTEIILLTVYQSDLLPETQTTCYAQMVSTIYDIEESYKKRPAQG
jgi:hypothetical protein